MDVGVMDSDATMVMEGRVVPRARVELASLAYLASAFDGYKSVCQNR
jgi:hypothetical protein